jgi:hypothetical protein
VVDHSGLVCRRRAFAEHGAERRSRKGIRDCRVTRHADGLTITGAKRFALRPPEIHPRVEIARGARRIPTGSRRKRRAACVDKANKTGRQRDS